MNPILSARSVLVSTALASVVAGLLTLPAPSASATPADGDLGAYAYSRSDVVDCDFSQPDNVQSLRTFNAATGRRTAAVEQTFDASPAGDPTVTAHGRVANSTSGLAKVRGGGFDEVVLRATQRVRVVNDTAADCGLGLIADTQSSADVTVTRRGRIHLAWSRGRAGQIEQILLTRDDNGKVVVDKIRPRRQGSLSARVRPGDYSMFVQFQTRANESGIAVGAARSKRAEFSVVADFRR